MTAKEIRDLSDDEIERALAEAREAYFNLRFQHASGSLERVSELSARRREIARLLTVARERELVA
jgi:large subunit ribosomal protein L29